MAGPSASDAPVGGEFRVPGPAPDLVSFQQKLQLLRDDAAAVALGYATGLVAYGPGGACKSWTVCDQLARMNVPVRTSTARMTGRARFDHLRAFPDDVTLIEDNEALFRDTAALSVLRAAPWASPLSADAPGGRAPQRLVTWAVAGHPAEFFYAGGLILVVNGEPPKTPEVDALLTRVPVAAVRPTDREMAAYARHLAAAAPPRVLDYAMTAAEAGEVCEFLLREARALNRRLDVRLLYKSYAKYVQFQNGDSGADWRDRVRAELLRAAPAFAHPVDLSGGTRADRLARDRGVVREILSQTGVRSEQVALWGARTGKCPRTFDSRKAEVVAEDGGS